MVILNYRSPYLRRVLSTNKKKNDGTLAHISVVLRYIYGGKLSLEEYEVSDIIKILITANELSLQELFPYLEVFLIKRKADWMEQNFDFIYRTSFKNDSFLQLQKYCTDLIAKEPYKIFNSPNFSLIPENLLISLIQNENVQLNEVQVWEHVIKWGLAQNPGLPSDIESFSKDDFNALKKTLQQCIPLIRFHNLTSKEFSEKVTSYKKIFPKELYKSLLKDFLNNDNKPIKPNEISKPEIRSISSKNIDSTIITFQHVKLISKWIDRLEYTNKIKNLFEFRLIFRGYPNECTAKQFHEICDNQAHTVTFIKVKDSNEILGGNNEYILSRVIDEKRAIRNFSFDGPSFGYSDLSFDIYSSTVSCNKNKYENQIRENERLRNATYEKIPDQATLMSCSTTSIYPTDEEIYLVINEAHETYNMSVYEVSLLEENLNQNDDEKLMRLIIN
ncbi:BTB/POZ protein [Rhizophagus irregularis DAOM 181602=DAOM 197198]|nr:BTB/POZ protein [Rhizophagus irregularis DAOM 181602=DAOM 197198]